MQNLEYYNTDVIALSLVRASNSSQPRKYPAALHYICNSVPTK